MNEQLQQAISQLITMSLVAIDKGATFLSGQIPDVIQQLLLWKAWESFPVTIKPTMVNTGACGVAFLACAKNDMMCNSVG